MAVYDMIVIGAGAAGMTAAIYGARRKLSVLVLEDAMPGGQMLVTGKIGNYPGFMEISGTELAKRMEEQVLASGAEIKNERAMKVDLKGEVKRVYTEYNVFEGKTVVIATGGKYRQLGARGEEKFAGKGVSYCATCDGPLFKGKNVAVVGGGNKAVGEALYLSEIASKVHLIHRREELRAEEEEVAELKGAGVEVMLNTVVDEIVGEGKVEKIKIRNVASGEARELDVDGVFISIGSVPNSEMFKSAGIEVNGEGYVVSDESQKTSIPGVFAAGDVDGGLLQLTVSVGEGATAAMAAYEYVKKPYWKKPGDEQPKS